jgi:beta-glucanase (GH16 family)
LKVFLTSEKGIRRKMIRVFLTTIMILVVVLLPRALKVVQGAESAINKMEYYSQNDGPIITKSGVDKASYGFVMPKFNGGSVSWEDVASDLTVNVKVDGKWVNIDEDSNFTYNENWGHWNDSGFRGYWFSVSETTYIQLASKANGVTLDYTLAFSNINKTTITSMAVTQGPTLTAGVTGSVGFTYPTFNGKSSIPYEAVADDLKVYVKTVGSSEWIDIDNNADSGWIYDKNFGQFTDGGGGYWFTVDESINVKLESKSSKVSLLYTINYKEAVRNSYTLTAYEGTSYTADDDGAIGIPLPKIDGSAATKSELDNFIYKIKVNGEWVELSDYSKSDFSYSGNGYNNLTDTNQWGYWVDYIYGLWFQPIQNDMELRIEYPLNGVKGGAIGNNYVTYTFTGNPDAKRPDVSDVGDIPVGTSDEAEIDGMNLVWKDEFEGTKLNTSVWNYNTGYYLSDDPGTWGWGNNELEHYTDSEKNTFVKDGSLNIVAYEEPKSFPQDPNRYAQYSSGKITTKDKFTFKYGRIDFRAKLPKGNGMWPALWMLPNDDSYGSWAASGEIDVMEARGRLPGTTSGAMHFGGQWPANTYISGDNSFPDGQTFDSDYHVYSLVWEEDSMKWYVDGKCFFKANSDQWYSAGASDNNRAPFDQEFYIIMNLAVGGWFDGGLVPNASDLPATMQVDYVRVYKAGDGGDSTTVPVTGMTLDQKSATLSAVGDTVSITKTFTPSNATNKNVVWESSNPKVATVSAGQVTAVGNGTATIKATTKDGGYTSTCAVTVEIKESSVIEEGNEIRGLRKTADNLEFYVNGAIFADLHYEINKGIQQNVAMKSDGKGSRTYTVSNLKSGDVIEYFFTYDLGVGALDTEKFQYKWTP